GREPDRSFGFLLGRQRTGAEPKLRVRLWVRAQGSPTARPSAARSAASPAALPTTRGQPTLTLHRLLRKPESARLAVVCDHAATSGQEVLWVRSSCRQRTWPRSGRWSWASTRSRSGGWLRSGGRDPGRHRGRLARVGVVAWRARRRAGRHGGLSRRGERGAGLRRGGARLLRPVP